jgi:WD40 repeat protein
MVQWSLETRRPTRTFAGDPGVIAVSPDGQLAAIGGADGTVSLVDLGTEKARPLSGRHGAAVYNATFSADGDTLATTSADGAVFVWDVGSGARREELSGHTDSVMTAAFSPDGETLYTASLDGTAIKWDLSGDRRLGRALAGEARSNTGRFSPDGKLIAVGLENGGIGLWDASSLEPVGVLGTPGPEPRPGQGLASSMNTLEFSPDGKTLGALNGCCEATLWDVETRSLLHRWAELWEIGEPAATIPLLHFSRDGTMVVVAAPTEPVTLWDPATGASLGEISWPASDVAFDPSDKLLAIAQSANIGHTLLWDIASRTIVADIATGAGVMYTVAFSPDGQTLATSGWDQVVRLWNVATREEIREIPQRDFGAAAPLRFSPDGHVLATSGREGNATLWDVASGAQIGKLDGRTAGSELTRWRPTSGGPVPWTTADFSPDGKQLLTTVIWGPRIVWDVDPESWAARACAIAGRTLTEEEWHQFLPDRPYEPACAEG